MRLCVGDVPGGVVERLLNALVFHFDGKRDLTVFECLTCDLHENPHF